MASVDNVLRRAMSAGLSPRRQLLGTALAVVGLVALTLGLVPFRTDLAVESVLLLYLLVVVATAAVGGVWPASAAAVVAVGLVNWFFTPPFHTLTIAEGEHVLALVVFLVVAAVVALYVTVADRNASESAAVRAEAAALDRANELRTALLSAVSHDLRTPLASIKASVSSLRAHDVRWSEQEAADFLAAIEDDTDRLNQLVGNLLDMSRLQTGALELMRHPVASRRWSPMRSTASALGVPTSRSTCLRISPSPLSILVCSSALSPTSSSTRCTGHRLQNESASAPRSRLRTWSCASSITAPASPAVRENASSSPSNASVTEATVVWVLVLRSRGVSSTPWTASFS